MDIVEQLRRAEIIRDYYRTVLQQVARASGEFADMFKARSLEKRALRSVAEIARAAADNDFSNL